MSELSAKRLARLNGRPGGTVAALDIGCSKTTCLIGRPATADHIAICNSAVAQASDVETGKKIAVATLLSAAHSCE